jgi:hypothetical protein
LVVGEKVLKLKHIVEEFHESVISISLPTSNRSGAVDWEHQSILVILGQDDFWEEIL